ncbi:hypothetical protein [Pygmaiobacter massiliensis]|uniref:hypothetical protein n=1 Tax=Pygmaiobacter massiliensis TaxID=1917873 RepID=UPI00289FEDFC|nr:hypothetical protein [Pygmaiobacter massiliensis]
MGKYGFFRKQKTTTICILFLMAIVIALQYQNEARAYAHTDAEFQLVTIRALNSDQDTSDKSVKIKDNVAEAMGDDAKSFVPDFVQSFTQMKSLIVENQGFQIVEPDKSEYGFGYFESTEPSAFITFNLPLWPETVITTMPGGAYQVEVGIGTDVVSWVPHIAADDDSTISVYPFHNSNNAYLGMYIKFIFFYALLVGTIFAILYTIYVFLISVSKKNKICFGYHPIALCCTIFFILFVWLSVTFQADPMRFAVKPPADAAYYMYPSFFDESGKFSLEFYVSTTMAHRGYYQQIVSLICNLLSTLLQIRPEYCHFFITSILVAVVFGIAIPEIYRVLTNRNPTNFSAIINFLLFFFYWRYLAIFVLSDIPSCMFAFGGCAFYLKGLKEGKYRCILAAGALASCAANYRSTYKLQIYLFAILPLVLYLAKRAMYKIKKSSGLDAWVLLHNFKTVVFTIVSFVGAAVFMALPQYYISTYTDAPSLFPHDIVWYQNYIDNYSQTLTEYSFQLGTKSYYFMSNEYLDTQMMRFWQTVYTDKIYQVKDILYLCMSNPLDFFIILLKKFFYGMSVRLTGVYVGVSSIFGNMALWMNYFIQGIVIYNAVASKGRKHIIGYPLYLFAVLGLVFTGVTAALLHIEYRYFLFSQIVIWMLFSFPILEYMMNRKKDCADSSAAPCLLSSLLYSIMALAACTTIECNFL